MAHSHLNDSHHYGNGEVELTADLAARTSAHHPCTDPLHVEGTFEGGSTSDPVSVALRNQTDRGPAGDAAGCQAGCLL